MFDKAKIEELYPEAVMIPAMKIHASTDSQLRAACDSGDYFGQLKKDGYWYQFEKHEHYSYLFSRSTSKKTGLQAEKLANVPHIAEALSVLPKDTILLVKSTILAAAQRQPLRLWDVYQLELWSVKRVPAV